MGISNIITLFGGVALFLFGMSLMGDGLKKVAGSKLELVLYKLSSTPLKGVLLGAGVTAIIQSSSATSVMVVGFVNSGMMKVRQAMAVIMGAIVGTSITGWIICLSYVEGSGGIVSLLSTSSISAIVAVVGIILRMFSKKQSKRHVGDILLGFSVLMFGMQAMSGAVAPLKESPAFIRFMTAFSNPLLGIVVGTVLSLPPFCRALPPPSVFCRPSPSPGRSALPKLFRSSSASASAPRCPCCSPPSARVRTAAVPPGRISSCRGSAL